MPRNGSGVYSLPVTYTATDGQQAEAAQHNDPLEDIRTDLNTARPIVAGGTGETTLAAARAAFGVSEGLDGVGLERVTTFAALASVTPTQAPTNTILSIPGIGTYKAVSSGEHLDYTSGVGTKWQVLEGPGGYTFQAFGAGSGSDSSAAVLAALTAAAGKPISGGGATVRLDAAIEYAGKASIRDVTFDFQSNGRIYLNGGLTALPALNANVSEGDLEVVTATAHGLSAGSVFCVYNATANSFYDDGAGGNHDGDWLEVSSVVDTTTVELTHDLVSDYASSDMTLYEMDGEGFELINVTGINSTDVVALEVKNHKRGHVSNFQWSEAGTPGAEQIERGLWINQCYNVDIFGGTSSIIDGTNSYPWSVSNSKFIRVDGIKGSADWHGFVNGGGTGAGSVPTSNVRISNSHLTCNSGVGASDFHSEVRFSEFVNCTLYQGAQMSGYGNRLTNCEIRARTDGAAVWGISGSPVGGVFSVGNCTITIPIDGTSTARAIEFKDLDLLEDDFTLAIDTLTVINKGSTQNLRLIVFEVGGIAHSHRINVRVGRINYIGPNAEPFAIFSVTGATDVSSQLSIHLGEMSIDQTHGATTPTFLAVTAASGNEQCNLRLPSQTVHEDFSLTTGISSETKGAGTPYAIEYPRVPAVMGLEVYKTDATIFTSAIKVLPRAYDVEEDSIRLNVSTPDNANFSAAADVRLSATVGIKD